MQYRPLLSLLTLSLLLAGCGSDGNGIPDAGPVAVDQCTNPSDLALTRPDAGTMDGAVLSEVGEAVRTCALGPCYDITLADGDITECVTTCLASTEFATLSDGCLGCYIDTFNCGREHCVVQCLGSDQAACDACLDLNCVPGFTVCSGLAPL